MSVTNQPNVYNGQSIYNLCNGDGTVQGMTLRFMFSDTTYNPQAAGVGASGTWRKKLDTNYNVWDWTNNNASWSNQFEGAFVDPNNIVDIIDAGNTSNLTSISYCFRNSTSLNSVCLFDTSNVLNISQAFTNTAIKTLPKFNFDKVTTGIGACLQCTDLKTVNDLSFIAVAGGSGLQQFFDGCAQLENVGTIYAPNVRQISYMFRGCAGLKAIPSISCDSAITTTSMFSGCRNVESGILDFYNYLSTKETTVTTYSGTFNNCGINTVTGSAELAQIPSSWGGTGA
jgi:hypothetical protein